MTPGRKTKVLYLQLSLEELEHDGLLLVHGPGEVAWHFKDVQRAEVVAHRQQLLPTGCGGGEELHRGDLGVRGLELDRGPEARVREVPNQDLAIRACDVQHRGASRGPRSGSEVGGGQRGHKQWLVFSDL